MLPLIGGAMVLIAFLTENAAENWSALHIEKIWAARLRMARWARGDGDHHGGGAVVRARSGQPVSRSLAADRRGGDLGQWRAGVALALTPATPMAGSS